jgi:hypothetical protein
MDRELQRQLQNVAMSLPNFGHLVDQSTGDVMQYDPNKVCPYLQHGILDFISEAPRDKDGFKKWLIVLSSRQVGKSVTAALGVYARTAFSPGVYSAIIADNKDRALDLFRAINECHEHWPDDVKAGTIPNKESRQLTFDHRGKIRTLSAEQNMVGIGRAMDNLHLSELPFWDAAGEAWNGIFPAIVNRKEAMVILESTPAPLDKPSAEWYRDMCAEARKPGNRWEWIFAPFYSSILNERGWHPDWVLTKTELDLLERFGPKGSQPESNPGAWTYLTLENLAFRRHCLEMDREIRRNPGLFRVYFPTDPITCWAEKGGGAIPPSVLEPHLKRILIPWMPPDGRYMEYEEPIPGAVYILGADPAGWLGGDQACFVVLKVYVDHVEQVAMYSSNEVTPPDFARKILEIAARYNHAETIVENNGVGLAVLSFLELASNDGVTLKNDAGVEVRYHMKNLYYHTLAGEAGIKPGRPTTARSHAEAMAALVDALIDTMRLHDAETVDQLGSYKRDKEVREGDRWQIVNPDKKQKGRRGKHHWDRVSALLVACSGIANMPQRFRPRTPEEMDTLQKEVEAKAQVGMTASEYDEALKLHERRKKRLAKQSRKK